MTKSFSCDESVSVQWQDPPIIRAVLFIVAVPLALFLLDCLPAVLFSVYSELFQKSSHAAMLSSCSRFAFGVWVAHFFYKFQRPYMFVLIGVGGWAIFILTSIVAFELNQPKQLMLAFWGDLGVFYGAFALFTMLFRFTEPRLDFTNAKQVFEKVNPLTHEKLRIGTCSRCGYQTVLTEQVSLLSFITCSGVGCCSKCNTYLGGNPINNIILGLLHFVLPIIFCIGTDLWRLWGFKYGLLLLVLFSISSDGARRMVSGFSGVKMRKHRR